MRKYSVKKSLILLAILLLPSLLYLFLHTGINNFKALPILGPKTANASGDTVYHKIPEFSFSNQNNKTITQKDYDGRIYVADFFFANCPTICPKMATHMLELQKHFYDRKDFRLLSYTVDPASDSVEALRLYANRVHAMDSVWNFLTGEKEDIYKLAFTGYFANAMKDEVAPGGFLHSSNLFLIDKQSRIRGVFDGTSTVELNDLMDAIEILYLEEYVPRKDK
ncbi:MAG: SCO family protein [Verrucomicrobia bacterium]|nr:SCO family protein [Verrucomicrobiota bacterium]|tara:strand:+ start:756 stop:1424 length:669 start_codon:yes stop_codon:yes gene_type:complete